MASHSITGSVVRPTTSGNEPDMSHTVDTDRTSDELAIRERERAYDAAWTAGDVEGLVGSFTSDAVIVNPYGQVINGVAQIELALRLFLSGEAADTAHSSSVSAVRFVNADVAIVDGEATIQGPALPGGDPVPPLVHLFTDVLVRRGDSWRISQVRAYTFMRRPGSDERESTPDAQ